MTVTADSETKLKDGMPAAPPPVSLEPRQSASVASPKAPA